MAALTGRTAPQLQWGTAASRLPHGGVTGKQHHSVTCVLARLHSLQAMRPQAVLVAPTSRARETTWCRHIGSSRRAGATAARHVHTDPADAQPQQPDVHARAAGDGGACRLTNYCRCKYIVQCKTLCLYTASCTSMVCCSCATLCCSENTCAGLQSGVSEFKNAREAMDSPLAQRLFGIDGVASVFFGSDFVTVSTRSPLMLTQAHSTQQWKPLCVHGRGNMLWRCCRRSRSRMSTPGRCSSPMSLQGSWTTTHQVPKAGKQAPTPRMLPDRISASQPRCDSADVGAVQATRSLQTPAAAPQTQPSRRMIVRWALFQTARCGS